MAGLFISFEGTEGAGKSTQIQLLAARLKSIGLPVRFIREPGGTPIGEEIRHTLKHSPANHAMFPETELLLMNASRAQIVREVIRPALAAGEIVLCDRFFDSTIAYQAFGRGMDLETTTEIIRFAVGPVIPDLTLLLRVPITLSEQRRQARGEKEGVVRDRMEEAGVEFFKRVEQGYDWLASTEKRIRTIDATASVEEVAGGIWEIVAPWIRNGKIHHMDPSGVA